MTSKSEKDPFTQAIESLESGDLEMAEVLFRKTIANLGPNHNQSILSFKSLISIFSEQGEYKAALNTSLELLDAQINTLGIRHADTSRTISNIYTLCNTLGKHDLANEIMAMAREAEQAQVADSVKKLRGENAELPEEDEEEGLIELPGAQTMIGKISRPVASTFNIMGKRLKRIVCVLILMIFSGAVFGGLFALKMLEGQDKMDKSLTKSYLTANRDVELEFSENGEAVFILGNKKYTMPTFYYKDPSKNLGSLLLTPLNARELWLYKTDQGINGVGNYTLYASDSTEMEMVSLMRNMMTAANRAYLNDQAYPESFRTMKNADMFEYNNPYTLREDYPIIQQLKSPIADYNHIDQLMAVLHNGGTWPGEAFAYPGAINCCHARFETENSFQERFVIHGFDRFARIIRSSNGKAFLLVSNGGTSQNQYNAPKTDLSGATRVSVIDQNIAGYSFLLKNRLALFYLAMAFFYFIFYKTLPDKFAKVLAFLTMLGFVLASLASAFIWMIPI